MCGYLEPKEPLLAQVEHVVVALSSLGTFVIALCGIRMWWHRFVRQADYRLARRLLTAVYHIRDGIKGSRNGALMFLTGTATWCLDDPNTEMIKTLSTSLKRIQDRFVRDSGRAYSLMLEAEVVWGDEFKSVRSNLAKAIAQYEVAISRWQAQAGQLPHSAKQIIQEYQHTINSEGLGMDKDKMLVELDEAVDAYTRLLSAKIRSK